MSDLAPTVADAIALANRGEHAGALEAIDRAIEVAPDAIEAHLAKGRILRAGGAEHGVVLRAFRRATECGAAPERRIDALREYAQALEPIGRHREAAAALEDALALATPENDHRRADLALRASQAHERAGNLSFALERHRHAEAHFREELRDLPAYYAREADLLERIGNMAELFECYSRLVEAAPDRVLFAQPDEARTGVGTERLRRLLHGINDHLAAHPGDLLARLFKAGLFYRLGRYRQAEALIQRALETAHDHFYAYHLLGKVRLRMGRPGAALEALERARPLAPDYLDLERDRAAALEACDRKPEALDVYARIETRWPGKRELLLRAARLREELGRHEEAYETLRQAQALALASAPDREALEKLAALAMRLQRPKEAEAHLDAAIRSVASGPGAAALRLERAAARAAAGALDAALDDLAGVMREAGDRTGGLHREAVARRVAVLVKLERGEEALAAVEELAALDGGEEERTLVLRGDALRAAHRFQESVQCYSKAADRKLADALLEHGTRLFEREEFKAALGKLNESFRRNPQAWEVLYLAAAAYARLGEAKPAAKYLEAAAKVNPGALALMEKDGDFDAVRGSPDVQGVMGTGK